MYYREDATPFLEKAQNFAVFRRRTFSEKLFCVPSVCLYNWYVEIGSIQAICDDTCGNSSSNKLDNNININNNHMKYNNSTNTINNNTYKSNNNIERGCDNGLKDNSVSNSICSSFNTCSNCNKIVRLKNRKIDKRKKQWRQSVYCNCNLGVNRNNHSFNVHNNLSIVHNNSISNSIVYDQAEREDLKSNISGKKDSLYQILYLCGTTANKTIRSPIITIYHPNTIFTNDGVYLLQGFSSFLDSNSLKEYFSAGFPINWREIIFSITYNNIYSNKYAIYDNINRNDVNNTENIHSTENKHNNSRINSNKIIFNMNYNDAIKKFGEINENNLQDIYHFIYKHEKDAAEDITENKIQKDSNFICVEKKNGVEEECKNAIIDCSLEPKEIRSNKKINILNLDNSTGNDIKPPSAWTKNRRSSRTDVFYKYISKFINVTHEDDSNKQSKIVSKSQSNNIKCDENKNNPISTPNITNLANLDNKVHNDGENVFNNISTDNINSKTGNGILKICLHKKSANEKDESSKNDAIKSFNLTFDENHERVFDNNKNKANVDIVNKENVINSENIIDLKNNSTINTIGSSSRCNQETVIITTNRNKKSIKTKKGSLSNKKERKNTRNNQSFFDDLTFGSSDSLVFNKSLFENTINFSNNSNTAKKCNKSN
ncbi:hypothetical protein EDEG_01351 [Edhazardia aedis USNM 41457]|uniref:Uncharacterized protein n=1 Tax=Edhazardia aedis (strain USNM 41457) TaxID=1003232 RepID=J9DPE2_EDHAE|nr:hypothetical protein EDEG_01351 [Edhazardia aedis USNM 41457]|eukprot:EJW04415.1 hypothetical protein EDEG_01351 [Edhazardia aedis USNM 41457]